MEALPKARTDLLCVESGNEILIYDTTRNTAFCLNESAAYIWNNCDGETTIDEVAVAQGMDRELVLLALDGLRKKHLLTGVEKRRFLPDGVSRRRLLMHAGMAAMAVPVILSVVAPAAAQAASCVAPFNLATGTSTAAQPANQACTNATNRCCSASSFNNRDVVDANGNHTCTVTCGNNVGGPAPL